MKNQNGWAYRILIIMIMIIVAVSAVIIYRIVGRNGVINRVSAVENDYLKEDILERMNSVVTQKFIEINNQAKENHQNIAELYNSDVVIEYLKQSFIIEEIRDDAGNVKSNTYKINPEKLQQDDNKIAGSYELEKRGEKYIVTYKNIIGEVEDIGELQISK